MSNLSAALPPTACLEFNLDRGQIAFRQGDKSLGMFAVLSGEIQLQRHTEAGVMVVIHTARAGGSFAEASLFSDQYHCDAVAMEASLIVRYDKKAINHLLATNPEFAATITRQFAVQIQAYRRQLELQAIGSAKERVFAGLVEGMLKSDIKTFASQIGLSHEAVYRALSELVAAHRIKKTGRGKYVWDLSATR